MLILLIMENNENKLEKIVRGPTLGLTDVSVKREMWKEIADEMNGEFHIRMTSSHDIEMHNISIPYKKWKIEISVSDTRPLKFHVQFTSRQLFELELSWEDMIEKIRKKFGASDLELGTNEFDHHYIIKSDRPYVVKELLTKEIQKTFLKYNIYSLTYHSEKNSTSSELTSIIQKIPGNKEMMLDLISTFKLLIDHLEKARIIG